MRTKNFRWELTYTDKVGNRSAEDVVAGEAFGDGDICRECVWVFKTLLSAVSKHEWSAEALYMNTA